MTRNRKLICALFLIVITFSLTVLFVNNLSKQNAYKGNIELAIQYLETHFNSTTELIYESELQGISVLGKQYSKTFWLYSDNLLCYHALELFKPSLADKIHSAYDYYLDKYSVPGTKKLGALFGEDIPDIPRGTNSYVAVEEDYVIGYDYADGELMNDWREYVDWLCYRAVDEYNFGNKTRSYQLVQEAIAMWDGYGFYDKPCHLGSYYNNYKIGLAIYTCHYVGYDLGSLEKEIEARMWSYQDPKLGGVITLTNFNGMPVGSCNAEATAATLLPYIYCT